MNTETQKLFYSVRNLHMFGTRKLYALADLLESGKEEQCRMLNIAEILLPMVNELNNDIESIKNLTERVFPNFEESAQRPTA